MKRILMLICAAAGMLLSSCNGGGEGLVFRNYRDSVGDGEGGAVSFAIASVDFPVKGDERVVEAINNWIASFTQGKIEGRKYKKYVSGIANRIFAKPKGKVGVYGGYENSVEISVSFDTTNIVTMSGLVYNYAGGEHGVHKSVGVTFRKSDGRMFCKEMISDYVNVEFNKLVTRYMMEYFDVNTMEQLRGSLGSDGIVSDPSGDWWVKLPGSFMPYIDKDGSVVVTYGLCEIAPYVVGEVESRIPSAEIMPFLTEDGKLFFD